MTILADLNTITVTQTPQAFTNTTGTIGWYKVAGADDTTYERVQPILSFMGKNTVHCGAVGAGQIAKIAIRSIN